MSDTAQVLQRFDAGANALSKVLQAIPAAMRADILEPACVAASQPIKEAARMMVPKDTGALMLSIDIKGISDKTKGTAAALTGPDRRYYKGGKALGADDDRRGAEKPANYAHLVEFGHVAAKRGENAKRGKRSSLRKKTAVAVGFVAPRPFLRPAFAMTKGEAEKILEREINIGISRVPGVKLRDAVSVSGGGD